MLTLQWELSPPILLHLTPNALVVLSDEGIYRLYDLSSPGDYTQYSLGSEVADLGIVSARAIDDVLVVLTGGLQFVEAKGWHNARISNFTDSGLTEAPHAWALIPPEHSNSGHVEVLFSTGSTVVQLDALERIDQHLSKGPFSHIALSPNGRFYALVTTTGILWVVSSDFARNLSEVDVSQFAPSSEKIRPDRAQLCGDNAVVLSWGGKVVVVGPGGDVLQYDCSPAAIIDGDIDGLRIISSSTSEIVQKVPGACDSMTQLTLRRLSRRLQTRFGASRSSPLRRIGSLRKKVSKGRRGDPQHPPRPRTRSGRLHGSSWAGVGSDMAAKAAQSGTVRSRLPRSVQPQRLCQHGADAESSQCCAVP